MDEKNEVSKLAHLARLKLDAQEEAPFGASVSSIIDYVKQLDKIDTTDIEPMSHVQGSLNVFRSDTLKASLPIEEALLNAPDTSGRFIRVPIIVEQES